MTEEELFAEASRAMYEQADAEIRKLREENQRLKMALHQIASIDYSAHPADDILAVVEIAVKALE